MTPRRRRISRSSSRAAAHAVVATACLIMGAACPAPAAAQSSRAWAGAADDAGREPLRVAAQPPAAPPAAAAIPTGNLLATLRDGGILMIPLVGCSFALVIFGIERAVSLRTARVVPRLFVTRFIERLQAGQLARGTALDACDENGSPAGRVFAAAVRRWGRPAVEIEHAAIDACERELNRLRRYRRVFNGVATIGPLLGLLGTVFGLIRSFNDVASAGAMGRPDLLAKGFGEALITTAAGLLVAIPAMVLHWWFTGRVDRLAMRLDETCQQVIDEISQEALAESRRRVA
ncbi:MAG: MotA/TolQ/ExbB proton channel family protein [Planctomycetaceae bacterium]